MSVATTTTTRSPMAAKAKLADKPLPSRRLGRALSFKRKVAPKQRKSRVIYHYTKEQLEPYFDISQKEAAKRLNIAVITLKRICKREKFNWPFRANKAKELHQRSQRTVEPTRRSKSRKEQVAMKQKTTHTITSQEESYTSEQEACFALQSLALSSMTLDHQERSRADRLTAAGHAFAFLPLLCMSENDDVIETIEL